MSESLSHFGSIAYQQSETEAPTLSNKINHTNESVRFKADSSDENDEEKLGNFVRTNTPHPKDLLKKKEMLKLRNSNNNNETNQQNEKHTTSRPNSFQSAINEPQLPIINSSNLQSLITTD
jgi:hypothetical protein